MTKYKYAIVDMSYVLMRNLFAISKGKKIGEFTPGELIRITIQTMNKLPRDFGVTADKFIFVYDKWDKELGGYYRTSLLGGDYKSTREHVTQDTVDQLELEGASQKDIDAAKLKVFTNQVKFDAKYGMINDLKYMGLPCLGLEGWEYDDLAWLSACMLYGEDSGKPSVFITKDSDLQYSLTPQMDYFKIPTGGSAPRFITYDEMCSTIPARLQGKVTLYQYKSLLDSLGEGHNDMTKTKKTGRDVVDTIERILVGDYSDIIEDRLDIFNNQMLSFDISKFPRLDEAKNIISEQFGTSGRLGSLDDFHGFCGKYGIRGISDKYFSQFISRFDPKLFIE